VGTGDAATEDERAALIMQLMLHLLDRPVPTMAHMLLGFDVEDGAAGRVFCRGQIITLCAGSRSCQPPANV
jgi:hypothetical protein